MKFHLLKLQCKYVNRCFFPTLFLAKNSDKTANNTSFPDGGEPRRPDNGVCPTLIGDCRHVFCKTIFFVYFLYPFPLFST
jgi:hypothetical protein